MDTSLRVDMKTLLLLKEIKARMERDHVRPLSYDYVLEDAMQYSDEQVMLVSDGVDAVDEAAARKASQIDMRCILIQENNAILEKYLRVQHVDKLEGNFLVEV